MNNGLIISKRNGRAASYLLLLTVLSLMIACGGGSGAVKQMGQYEAGSKTMEDVETLLKNDSRVEGYNPSGDTLTVNVKESFTSAPYGMQQRAMWNWYNTWQAAKSSKNASVVVQSNGADVATWNDKDGYKPAAQAKSEE